MSINELKIYFDLNPESKSKILDKYANNFDFDYFFVDSENGQCYLFDEHGNEKDVLLIHEIYEDMIPKDIKKIVIPKNVISIDEYAFYVCSSLTSVTISDSVTSIGGYAFRGCSGLTSVTIPDGVTSIGGSAFRGCSGLTSVTIPNSVTSIGPSAFSGCSGLTNVMIGNGVKSIESYVFFDCNKLDKIIFKNKRIDQVKAMLNYPFGIKDESIIKVEFD